MRAYCTWLTKPLLLAFRPFRPYPCACRSICLGLPTSYHFLVSAICWWSVHSPNGLQTWLLQVSSSLHQA